MLTNARKVFAAALSVLAIACGGGSSPSSPSGSTGGTSTTGSITIGGTLSAQVGATSQLTAEVKDANGATVSGAAVSWSSSDTSVVSISGTGLATVAKIGPVTITASAASASATGTATFTGRLSPYTFDINAASAGDQRIIYDAVQFAHSYFLSAMGRTIANATTVTASTSAQGCAMGGSAAFTGAGAVTFCVGNPGWLQPGPTLRQKITMHEIFHLLQFEMRWLGGSTGTGAEWIVEGSAELVGFRALAAKGPLSFDTAVGCMAKEVSDFNRNPPGLSNLSAYEGPQQFRNTQGPLYSLAMLGMNQLSPNTLTAVKAFGDSMAGGTQYPVSFLNAFGQSTATFYAQWPTALAALPVPPNYLCGG